MAEQWSEAQSNQITALYSELKGGYKREADQKLFSGAQLPYLDAFNTLKSLIDEQEKKTGGGLEAKMQAKSAPAGAFPERISSATGLLGLVLSAYAFTISPFIGLAALGGTALMLRNYRLQYDKGKN